MNDEEWSPHCVIIAVEDDAALEHPLQSRERKKSFIDIGLVVKVWILLQAFKNLFVKLDRGLCRLNHREPDIVGVASRAFLHVGDLVLFVRFEVVSETGRIIDDQIYIGYKHVLTRMPTQLLYDNEKLDAVAAHEMRPFLVETRKGRLRKEARFHHKSATVRDTRMECVMEEFILGAVDIDPRNGFERFHLYAG